jgi:recombinational DNA repair protein (RecF pathway)
LDVLVKGAKSVGGKKSTVADLFRVIRVEINPNRNGLQTAYSLELIEIFDDIALRHESYLDACAISEFALRNSHPGVACPEFHLAVRTAFSQLSQGKCANATTLVKLAFLDEHGFLPEAETDRQENALFLRQIIAAAKGAAPIPVLPDDYMMQFSHWIDSLCAYHEL